MHEYYYPKWHVSILELSFGNNDISIYCKEELGDLLELEHFQQVRYKPTDRRKNSSIRLVQSDCNSFIQLYSIDA